MSNIIFGLKLNYILILFWLTLFINPAISIAEEKRGDSLSQITNNNGLTENKPEEDIDNLLEIHGLKDRQHLQEILKHFSLMPWLNNCRAIIQTGTMATLRCSGYIPPAEKLQTFLRSKHSLGIEFISMNQGIVKLKYSPYQVFKLNVAIGKFDNLTGVDKLDWLEKSAGDLVGILVDNNPFINVTRFKKRLEYHPESSDFKAGLNNLRQKYSVFYYLKGDIISLGIRGEVRISVYDTRNSKQIYFWKKQGEFDQIPAILQTMGEQIAEQLNLKIVPIKKNEPHNTSGLTGLVAKYISDKKRSPLWLEKFKLTSLYPVKWSYYNRYPPIILQMKNRGKKSVKNLQFIVRIPGITDTFYLRRQQLLSKKTLEIPLDFRFIQASMAKVEKNMVLPCIISYSFEYQEEIHLHKIKYPLIIHSRNQVDLEDVHVLSSFINPFEPALKNLVQQLKKIPLPSNNTETLRKSQLLPMVIVNYLLSLGFQWSSGGFRGIDQRELVKVRFPFQTLKSMTANNTDLTVLTASLLEAAGIKCKLLLSRRHLLLLLNSGSTEFNSHQVSFDRNHFIHMDKIIWIPLELSSSASSFWDCWMRGARIAAASNLEEMEEVNVEEGWETYAPLTIDAPIYSIPNINQEKYLATIADNIRRWNQLKSQTLETRLNFLRSHIRLNRRNINMQNEMGMLLAKGLRLNQALSTLSAIVERYPNQSYALNNLGNIYLLLGSGRIAVDFYNRALDNRSVNPAKIYYNLALALYLMDDRISAISTIKKALAAGIGNWLMAMEAQIEWDNIFSPTDIELQEGIKMRNNYFALIHDTWNQGELADEYRHQKRDGKMKEMQLVSSREQNFLAQMLLWF